jgi:hypothetical protein
MTVRLWLLVSCALALGCGSVPVVEQVPVPSVAPLPSGARVLALLLDRVVFDVPKGTVVGEARRGKACIDPVKIVWRSESPRAFSDGPYHVEFTRVVTGYGFAVPERPKSLFATPTVTGNELIIAARIPTLTENICSGVDINFWTGSHKPVYKGNVRFLVQWEVFSVAEKRVVLALETEGSAIGEDFKSPDEQDYRARAFANALRALLSRDEFRELIALPVPRA